MYVARTVRYVWGYILCKGVNLSLFFCFFLGGGEGGREKAANNIDIISITSIPTMKPTASHHEAY